MADNTYYVVEVHFGLLWGDRLPVWVGNKDVGHVWKLPPRLLKDARSGCTESIEAVVIDPPNQLSGAGRKKIG